MYRVKAHEQGSNLIVSYDMDVEPLLNANHKERREHSERTGAFGKKGEFRKIMSVDPVTLMRICKETGLDFFNQGDAKEILKILKRPEYAKFRTVPDKRI